MATRAKRSPKGNANKERNDFLASVTAAGSLEAIARLMSVDGKTQLRPWIRKNIGHVSKTDTRTFITTNAERIVSEYPKSPFYVAPAPASE